MARFFIDRPIFAWVIAIIIMLAGALSISRLPIARFPDIAPPVITINTIYPGASAAVVADSVTQIVEQNMKGLDGLLFMTSSSDATGRGDRSRGDEREDGCDRQIRIAPWPAS
ncbi:MAG: efflux RND transporter permease subunit, partial [Steroidobacteraceae bacterium]